MFRKVIVGLSGGVDSAVAALLLKEKGFSVVGAFMKNWDLLDETGNCSSINDFKDAQHVAHILNIPLVEVNFVPEYWNYVFLELLKDYESGLTPNPDVLCNRYIKFEKFFSYSIDKLKADAIATGHYASSSFGPYLEYFSNNKRVKLYKSVDTLKDQSFFLSQIPNSALKKTMFPLGGLCKSSVKSIAHKNGLGKIASKKESMGICFIGSRKFQSFISEYIKPKDGYFIDIDDGKVVGTHDGVHMWTVGQRCKISGMKEAYYICRKEINGNIFVALGHEHPALYNNTLTLENPFWIDTEPPDLTGGSLYCEFRFQHRKPLVKCEIEKLSDIHLKVKLSDPLRALTPGQYGVLYYGNECLGSGRIISAYSVDTDQTVRAISR